MLTYQADPLEKRRFGGSERDLETVTAYRHSVRLLEEKMVKEGGQQQEDEQDKGSKRPVEETMVGKGKPRQGRGRGSRIK